MKESPVGGARQGRPKECSNVLEQTGLSEHGCSSATIDAVGADDYFSNIARRDVSPIFGAEISTARPTSNEQSNATYGRASPDSSRRVQICLDEDTEPDGGVGETFERAACLLRESVDADGVLLLDATVRSYGGAVTGRQCWSDSEIEEEMSSSTEADYASDDAREKTFHADCRILGSSRRGGSAGNDNSPGHGHPIPEKILKSLLRHYPQGAVVSEVRRFHASHKTKENSECQVQLIGLEALHLRVFITRVITDFVEPLVDF